MDNTNSDNFLDEVFQTLISRQKSYGNAKDMFDVIASRWSSILGHTVTPKQVAMCMIDLKLARLTQSPDHRDSMIDIAGYAALMSEL